MTYLPVQCGAPDYHHLHWCTLSWAIRHPPTPQPHLWLPLLLHIEQGDRLRIPKQQAAGARVEDLIAVGHLHFLSDLVLQVLDKELWGKRWAAVKVRAQETQAPEHPTTTTNTTITRCWAGQSHTTEEGLFKLKYLE